ncbi:MAG: hypothetical protein IJ381_07875 [Clostridia bacterium]|nr:hypothetical protein [Clostridia bacterium]
MKSDLTCPVEITKVTVNREIQQNEEAKEHEQIVCLIEFFNLSEKVIDSLQMNIICFDAQGERLGGRLVRAGARGEGRSLFSGTFMPEHVDGAVRVEASVEKVWYQDGMIWRREERNVREYTPNALAEGRELDRLRAVAGPDAAGYAREDDIVWMCVCGRANRTSDDKCMRCERERVHVLKAYSFEAIDSTEGRKERELEKKTQDTLRRSSETTVKEQNEIDNRKKRRGRTLKTVIVLLILVVIALLMGRWGVPYAACYLAEQKAEEKLHADAKAVYAWVETYWPGLFGAGEKADEQEEMIIGGLLDVGKEVALEEAAARAKNLQTQNGAALHDRAVIDLAKLKRDSGKDEEAEKLLLSLPHSEEANALLFELVYDMAGKARNQLDYPTALARYESLGDYQDAKELVRDCTYDYGRHLMLSGEYEAACAQLLKVSGMGDAIALIRQCRYNWAIEEQEKGELVHAAELFETLGIYEEAETRAKACRYDAGMAAIEKGALEEAAEHLKLAEDYEDAQERFADAAFTLGASAYEAREYEAAIAWLEQLAREGEAGKMLNQAIYDYAAQLEADGYLESAALQFASLGDYQDADARGDKIEYQIARSEMEESPESALLRFEGLGKYEDAQRMALVCRYTIAQKRYADGEYGDALARFEALGDFEDAKLQARRSRYAQASRMEEEEKYAEAAALFKACGAYLDAEERTMRAQYALGAAYEAAGAFEQAAGAFAVLGSYEDAKQRVSKNEDSWLLDVYQTARMDMELGDFASVIRTLEPYRETELPVRYEKMHEMYEEACLSRAQELTEKGRPLDALPILESLGDHASAKKRLNAYVYRIIGRWKDARGTEYVFRRDGSCSIAGTELYFGGAGYEIRLGEEPYPTKAAYSVVNLRGNALSLKNLETKSTVRLTYVGEETAKEDASADEQKEEAQTETN